MDFAAIDFETANQRPDSPCQLAVVVIEQGEIIREKCWLIRPKRLYFSSLCIAVHGILPEHVQDQPEWDELWPEILDWIDGRVLIAHNAGFDLRVLCSTLQAYDLVCPDMEYGCTRLLGRKAWPGRNGYGLKAIAERLSIEFQHHDALEDARTCAKIALAAAATIDARSLDEVDEKFGILRGRVRFGAMTNPRSIRRSKRTNDPIESPEPRHFRRDGWPTSTTKVRQRLAQVDSILSQGSHSHPEGSGVLSNKSVVLTGTLLGMDHQNSVQFLERLGARVQPQINLETDLVIVGQTDTHPASLRENPEGFEQRATQVKDRQREGQPIRILSQRQLLGLIPGGLEAARAITG